MKFTYNLTDKKKSYNKEQNHKIQKKDLENRLNSRGTDPKEDIRERLNKAKKEILEKEKFDVVIMNGNIEKSKSEVLEIVSKFLNT